MRPPGLRSAWRRSAAEHNKLRQAYSLSATHASPSARSLEPTSSIDVEMEAARAAPACINVTASHVLHPLASGW